MSKKFKLELIVPIGFLLLGGLILWETRNLSSLESAFPKLVCTIMLAAAAVLLVLTLIKKQVVINTSGMHLGHVLIVAAALGLYIFLLPILGYILCSIALGSFLIFMLGYRNIPVTLIGCTIFTAVVFIIFKVLLNVPLPTLFLNF